MEVLISGAGIAGSSLAWWLVRAGHGVTLLEKAAELRTGGYIIDFWGKGYDLAERMGLMPRLQEAGYHVSEVALLDDRGRRAGGFDAAVFDRATGGRFISLPRGELAAALHDAVKDDIDTIFGDEIAALEPDEAGISVCLEQAGERRFDLVVAAEGIHSHTRELVFGPEEQFERFLGYAFAAYLVGNYQPRWPDIYVMHGEPGREALRFALKDGSTLVLLVWREVGDFALPHDAAAERALLRDRFAGAAWEVPALLEALDTAYDLYFDRVSQIRMETWHKGRVVMAGDTAFAPSFLAGQGAALAMIGSYVLAGELGRAGPEAALPAYQARLQPLMIAKQDAARRFARTFVPGTRLGLAFRNLVSHFLNVGWIANRAFGGEMRDQIELPEYA